ncbi:uncharacterized protein LOC122868701 [Siniperca chuatsi]|uniref:uncharacterized protein LOC122868701 n=1 Tax=Siniperca chuatsi TaxID=119488 RepID=UPI001CE05BB0|nr:uncharacterized protein LOC122868701 [Siniperca chuatsi]
MALGLLLLVSWISFLLFDDSTGLPAIKGFRYQSQIDSRNLIDDGEDEVFTSPTLSNRRASNNQPTGPVYTSYNKPLVAQQPDLVPSRQNLPDSASVPEVEKLVNGEPRDWGLGNLDKPLSFPLNFNYQPNDPAKPQPGPVQPQSSLDTLPATRYASAAVYYEPAPSFTSEAAESPSFESWQPEPVSSAAYSTAGGDSSNVPHLVYENVFHYPSENTEPSQSYGAVSNIAGGSGQMTEGSSNGDASTLAEQSFPSYPTNVGAQPVFSYGMGSPSTSREENLNFGQTDYQPHQLPWYPQKPLFTQKDEFSQGLSELSRPRPPLSSRIVQSRNGYKRRSYLFNKSRYSPELGPQMPVSWKGVGGPAPSRPAAPKA